MDIIKKYFGELPSSQLEQLEALLPIYSDWNSKINLISRKDMDQFYEHHVLHSLAIAKYIKFVQGTTILDVGTGGGFPGIPLAILFPSAEFVLVDSIGKKIMVVNAVAEALGLKNVKGIHQRAETLKDQYDFVVSRAVTNLPEFINWTGQRFHGRSRNLRPNGILYLKGGDIKAELDLLSKRWIKNSYPIKTWFEEPFFDTKSLIHLY
jgi:16S rRNA (guanine527-N7)-methyltransferase